MQSGYQKTSTVLSCGVALLLASCGLTACFLPVFVLTVFTVFERPPEQLSNASRVCFFGAVKKLEKTETLKKSIKVDNVDKLNTLKSM
jgi:ABC-type spermidine/putrescine transport system permease subunit I